MSVIYKVIDLLTETKMNYNPYIKKMYNYPISVF